MRESKYLEYKESVTNTFLKTVSAYANYGSGEIVFGIADDGQIIGIDDPEKHVWILKTVSMTLLTRFRSIPSALMARLL